MADLLSVPLPSELKKEMAKHKEIKWVEVARQAFRDKVEVLEKLDGITAKSLLTERDVERHSTKVKAAVWKKHKKTLGL